MSKEQFNKTQPALIWDLLKRGKNKVAAQNYQKTGKYVSTRAKLWTISKMNNKFAERKREKQPNFYLLKTLYFEIFSYAAWWSFIFLVNTPCSKPEMTMYCLFPRGRSQPDITENKNWEDFALSELVFFVCFLVFCFRVLLYSKGPAVRWNAKCFNQAHGICFTPVW